jgi:hypothetical protein
MSIAAGKAYSFHDFKIGGISKETFVNVLWEMWIVFLKDLRLFKIKRTVKVLPVDIRTS